MKPRRHHSGNPKDGWDPAAIAIERLERDGSYAFRLDLFDCEDGILPPEYDLCDVIYNEPPWRAGFKEFERRMGKGGRRHADLLTKMAEIIERNSARVPLIFITGDHAKSRLPTADRMERIWLFDCWCWAFIYGEVPGSGWRTTTDLLTSLAGSFNHGGDFCCGYGATAEAFIKAGKTFTVSDFDPRCIGLLKQRWDEAKLQRVMATVGREIGSQRDGDSVKP